MATVDITAIPIISIKVTNSNNCSWNYLFSSPPFFNGANRPMHNCYKAFFSLEHFKTFLRYILAFNCTYFIAFKPERAQV